MDVHCADPCVAVAAAFSDLGRHGMAAGSSGNVSLRTEGGMCITVSGASAGSVSPSQAVLVSFDGRTEASRAPSSEWMMHAAIYRRYPEAGAVVHAHSNACTALSCLAECLPPFHYMLAMFGGDDVRCAPYRTFGTASLAAAAAAALDGRTACLLANHGMVLYERTPARAVGAALVLETLCQQYLLARCAGTPRLLSPEEMRAAHQRFRCYQGAH